MRVTALLLCVSIVGCAGPAYHQYTDFRRVGAPPGQSPITAAGQGDLEMADGDCRAQQQAINAGAMSGGNPWAGVGPDWYRNCMLAHGWQAVN